MNRHKFSNAVLEQCPRVRVSVGELVACAQELEVVWLDMGHNSHNELCQSLAQAVRLRRRPTNPLPIATEACRLEMVHKSRV